MYVNVADWQEITKISFNFQFKENDTIWRFPESTKKHVKLNTKL